MKPNEKIYIDEMRKRADARRKAMERGDLIRKEDENAGVRK